MPFLYDMRISIFSDNIESISRKVNTIEDSSLDKFNIHLDSYKSIYYSFSEMLKVLKNIYLDKDCDLNSNNNAYVVSLYTLEHVTPLERNTEEGRYLSLEYISKRVYNIDDTMRINKNDKLLEEYMNSSEEWDII